MNGTFKLSESEINKILTHNKEYGDESLLVIKEILKRQEQAGESLSNNHRDYLKCITGESKGLEPVKILNRLKSITKSMPHLKKLDTESQEEFIYNEIKENAFRNTIVTDYLYNYLTEGRGDNCPLDKFYKNMEMLLGADEKGSRTTLPDPRLKYNNNGISYVRQSHAEVLERLADYILENDKLTNKIKVENKYDRKKRKEESKITLTAEYFDKDGEEYNLIDAYGVSENQLQALGGVINEYEEINQEGLEDNVQRVLNELYKQIRIKPEEKEIFNLYVKLIQHPTPQKEIIKLTGYDKSKVSRTVKKIPQRMAAVLGSENKLMELLTN